ncbi:uncharacterized protein LOC141685613 [Apium graveolens]|uniref:uncharacterized protein LOC141685613 n=1 Tax=Apium graveolens TaxID=4045 RepID=UPI003D7BEED2
MQHQYPLLFPHGDIGYYREIPLNRPVKHSKRDVEVTESEDPNKKGARKYITMREFYNYKLMIRLSEGLTAHLGGRLWQQYIVDAFTAIEKYRLDWIRDHQTTIRSDLYHNIRDAMQKGDRNPSNIGKAIILPSSFTGSKRYMTQYFKDSLAICRTLGHPSLFLTMTTNTKWPEIQRMLKHMPGVNVADAPDALARVFKMKVDQLMDMIEKKNCFGRCIGAEIPDPEIDLVGYNAVSNYLIHGPCGLDYTKSSCMVKGNCIKHFPKRYNSHTFFDECGFPIYKRRRTGITINKKGVNLENRIVIPFNRDLLVYFQCYMNLEIYNNSRSLKYLFKYCLKGHDTAIMCLRKTRTGTSATIPKKHQKVRLMRKKGSMSFKDLKTVNGHIHETFKEACAALGLLQNDNQWHEVIAENSHTSLPPQLRAMFVNILAYSPISDPLRLWEANWQCMLDDILIIRRHMLNDPHLYLSDEDLKNYALAEFEKLFNDIGKSLKDYATMPFPSGVYFSNADSTAGIRHGTDIAELIQQTDLIIWDEAPMQHRHVFESVDRSLRDIMSAIDKRRAKKPFGGIIVVFGGDYRQILPVIPKASRAEIVGSTLNKSKIWEFCQVFLLKQNMRLHARNT